ncbi:MAG TPA: HAMP domain-containing sensor histidine kinase [Ktedonobacterales bacterium]|nr:HAMP domain-containing sensor histidine kinase [Ktedonobacterales bacterium]
MDLDVVEPLPASSHETQLAQEFIRARRLRITAVIARAFAVLLSIFVVLYSFLFASRQPGGQQGTAWLAALALVGCVALFGYAAYAAAHALRWQATTSTLLATDITIIWVLFFWSTILKNHADSITLLQFVSLSIAIMLAGTIGNAALVVTTTLLMNGVALVISLAYSPSPLGLFLAIGIMQQWTVATLAIVIASSYQQALRDLSLAYARTRQLEELKERFITNVNHELRTPVMTVLGYLDFLQRTWQTLPPEQLTRSFQKAREVGEHLMRLIQSILDVRRIDDSHIETPEPVVLRDICDQALQLIDPREARLATRRVTFEIPEGLAVWGEPIRLQQVLTNLLSNAGKYSPPGTPIEVAAMVVAGTGDKAKGKRGSEAEESRQVEITVRDYGLGIPPDQADLLFNRFVRLPRDLASTTVGNGLGLYLCRTLVTAMSGQIWVESTGVSGEGSAFHVQLPLCQVSASLERVAAPTG